MVQLYYTLNLEISSCALVMFFIYPNSQKCLLQYIVGIQIFKVKIENFPISFESFFCLSIIELILIITIISWTTKQLQKFTSHKKLYAYSIRKNNKQFHTYITMTAAWPVIM